MSCIDLIKCCPKRYYINLFLKDLLKILAFLAESAEAPIAQLQRCQQRQTAPNGQRRQRRRIKAFNVSDSAQQATTFGGHGFRAKSAKCNFITIS
jgi:hypothetical protein